MAKIIEDDVVKAIINYFGTRPYNEVCQVMPVLMTLPDADKGSLVDESKKDNA